MHPPRKASHPVLAGGLRRLLGGAGAVALCATLAATPAAGTTTSDEVVLPGPAYDIAATPSGSVLVGVEDTVHEITRSGRLRTISAVPSPTPLNGLVARGARNAVAVSGGLDQGAGAAVWHVTPGGARMVADIQAYEREHDPDVHEGSRWKDPECELLPPPDGGVFSAGPQSNPYKLTRVSGDEVLLADAAGNAVLSVRQNGTVETVAVLDPPVDEAGAWRQSFTLEDGTPCYVQPVPTSVAVGPDGAIYVGELTGDPGGPGWSRIWRVEPGARGVSCPSDACTVAFDGRTSVVDLELAPDGDLLVVELEQAGWAAGPDEAVGGAVLTCSPGTGECETVEDGLPSPNAVTVNRGHVWLLEGVLGTEPTVRRLTTPEPEASQRAVLPTAARALALVPR